MAQECLDSSHVIGVQEESIYRLSMQPFQVLVHDSTNLGELWHMRLSHLHYRALPSLRMMLSVLPVLHVYHDRICRGCVVGKNAKGYFPSSDSRSKGILDLVLLDLCGPMTRGLHLLTNILSR